MSKRTASAAVAADLPKIGFIRLPVVLRFIPVCRAAWWKGVREGRYPQGIKLGPRTTAWDVQAIRSLIDNFNEGDGK